MNDELARVITDAVKRHALGPSWGTTATAWPLSARGDFNQSDDWWATDNDHGKRRAGSPCITVWNERKWVATVLTSPKGHNQTIYFPSDKVTLIPVKVTT